MNFRWLAICLSENHKNRRLDMKFSTEVKINPFNLLPFVPGKGPMLSICGIMKLRATMVGQSGVEGVKIRSKK